MSNTRVTIDPNGDTLVILATKQDPPSSKDPTKPAGTTESPTFIEKHFLCSQKHLTLASRRASKLFSSAFKEALKQDDGLYHWNFGDVFDVQAFEVVLKIIHGKTRRVPQRAKLNLLSKIASIVDDLECYDALSFCTETWLSSYGGPFYTLPQRMDKKLAQLILVSFVFANKQIFRDSTKRAARYTCEGMPTFDLPIRADIPRRIEESRIEVLQYLVDGLYKVHDDLLQRKLGCSEGCRALLLGSFLQVMTAAGLYPRPESPFYSLRLDSIISSLRDIQPSIYYSSVTGGLAGKHSGTWLLHEQPTSPPTPQSNTATIQSTSSLFGSGFSGSTTSTRAQNTSDPSPAHGGVSGAPGVDPWGFGASNTPGTTGGLFGRNTAPQPTSALPATSGGLFGTKTEPQTSDLFSSDPAKSEEVPKKLVQHSCFLKSFIDPLLLDAEMKTIRYQLKLQLRDPDNLGDFDETQGVDPGEDQDVEYWSVTLGDSFRVDDMNAYNWVAATESMRAEMAKGLWGDDMDKFPITTLTTQLFIYKKLSYPGDPPVRSYKGAMSPYRAVAVTWYWCIKEYEMDLTAGATHIKAEETDYQVINGSQNNYSLDWDFILVDNQTLEKFSVTLGSWGSSAWKIEPMGRASDGMPSQASHRIIGNTTLVEDDPWDNIIAWKEDATTAMSALVRTYKTDESNTIQGYAEIGQPTIIIHWAWLSLLATQILLMVVFVVYVILETAKLDIQVVKGSNVAELKAMGQEDSIPESDYVLAGGIAESVDADLVGRLVKSNSGWSLKVNRRAVG
ncbi:hypothetical protein FPRO03_12968 [Fusarium proliferatum]|nr:hypothetical protein FPRO03_12968 [Fusarium proliferatum]